MQLEGVRVLDFGWVWAGALPGQMLAFMGAEVIKVESSKRIDYMRLGPPIVGDKPDPEQQPMFHNVNRGKQSFSLNLQAEGARELVLDLVEHCDVVIENFSPGVLDRLRLDYGHLRERRPDLVMLSLSGGGQTGDLSALRSYASTISAYSGLDSLCGYPGEEPVGIQQSYADPNASLFGAVGVVSALIRRNRTGLGEHIDLAQLDAGLSTVGEAMAAIDLFGSIDAPLGNNAWGGELIHGTYRCAGDDEWVAVSVEKPEGLQPLAELLGISGGVDVRVVEEKLRVWCGEWGHAEAMRMLQGAGVAAGAVTSAADRFGDDHFRARGAYVETEHPVIGWEVVYGEPFKRLNDVSESAVRRAPLLGESNKYVICELLGRSEEELEKLVAAEIVC
jgi:benzylsuccinate CoA-transferase BbsF subunit